jgi:hypothetical protein
MIIADGGKFPGTSFLERFEWRCMEILHGPLQPTALPITMGCLPIAVYFSSTCFQTLY